MAFITPFKERAARKEPLYEVIFGDLIKLGVISDPSIKTAKDLIRLLEDPEQFNTDQGVVDDLQSKADE